MQLKFDLKKIIPHLSAILLFLVISFAYFPEVLDGKKLTGHDNATFAGMSKEIVDYREKTGEEPLWTNRMFGGMPAYLISTRFPGNLLMHFDRLMQAGPRPVSFVFLYLIGFYILLVALRVNPWLSIAGAIAFAFSSYNFIIIAAGHNSKAIAIAYMAPVLAGILLTFRGKLILGGAVTALFMALQIIAGHPQITYYTLIIVIIFGISQLYLSIREKYLKELSIILGILVIAVILGVATNAGKLYTTMEYGRYSMRSPSELSVRENDQTSGLTKSYATQWSYGIGETFTLLIPNFRGGSVDGSLRENSETYRLFAQNNPSQAREVIKHLPLYWGDQPTTLGPVYAGAIVIFLFILGMFIVDKRLKWWLFAATVLSILLSWGKNFMFLTEYFLDNFPGYNKFRTVSMILVIAEFTMPLLAILALKNLLFDEVPLKKFNTALKWSFGIAGGLTLLFTLFPDLAGNFTSFRDAQYQEIVAKAFQDDRRSLLRMDALRSFIFIALTAGLILLYRMKKINLNLAIAIIGILFLADMWPVNKRYLNKDDFVNKREAQQPFKPTAADQFILNDRALNFRVLNLTQSVFQEAGTSYFHNSIGGYHGAKMRRYQDLIDNRFDIEINRLIGSLQSQNMDSINNALLSANALNMLNTKYIIINPQGQPLMNPYAPGNAWFASRYRIVANADEEIASLEIIDVDSNVTIDARFAEYVNGKSFIPDPSAIISLLEYQPNRLVYQSGSSTEQLAVFSEIFYEKGWNAYIDGKPHDHFRVNYVLRGMVIPEGQHEIVFEFYPVSYFAGNKISLAASLILLLLLAGAVFYQVRYGDRIRTKDLMTGNHHQSL